MEAKNHSQCPWSVSEVGSIVDADGVEIIYLGWEEEPENAGADYLRAVACVNACEGIEDPANVLESVRNTLLVLATRPAADTPGVMRANEALARAALYRLTPAK